jgi:hypothetical protein
MRTALHLLAACSLSASALAAAGEPVPFHVEASGRCGNGQAFETELLRRSRHVRPATARERGFAFQIEVLEHRGALRGRLTLTEPNGRVTVREVPAGTCDEVLPAMAIIAAVLVEPEQRRPDSAAPVRTEAGLWGAGANAGVLVQGAVTPVAKGGFSLEANVDYDGGGWLSPLFALAYARTLTERVPTESGVAEFEWWTLRASLCPARWPETGRLAMRPCALFDVGRLSAQGDETIDPASASMTWVAAGATARLDASPVGGLWVTGEAGIVVPFDRDRFYLDPGITAFAVPGVGGLGRLAVGGRFE